MKRDRRLRLNLLSMLAFGVKSRWKSILKRGTIVDGRWESISEETIEKTMQQIISTKEEQNGRRLREKSTDSAGGTSDEARHEQDEDGSTTSGSTD